MTYIKIDNTLYPTVSIVGYMIDGKWDNRESKAITMESTYEDVKNLMVDDVVWSIVERADDSEAESEYDNSEFSLSGAITDHRDGTITIKMGKMTDLEEVLMML